MEDCLCLQNMKVVDLEHLVKANELISNSSLVDRMSSLPWEMLDNILGRLPIDVVARMSVLSRRWKNCWKYVSSVILLEGINSRVVYHVLLSHLGNVEKFTLPSFWDNSQKEDLSCWLDFLRRNGNGIMEISLEFHAKSTCLSGIHGFGKLVTLTLSNFTTDASVLETVLGGCPLLENLNLSSFHVWECIHIHAHMLRSLHIDGNFKDLYIESHPRLTDVHLNLQFSPGTEGSKEAKEKGVANHLVKFLGHRSQIKKLTLCGSILKIWVKKIKSEINGSAWDNLSVLRLLDVRDEDVQISALCVLLQTFPNLREFSINLTPSPNRCIFGSTSRHQGVQPDDLNFCFDQLNYAKIEAKCSSGYGDDDYDDTSLVRREGDRSLGRALIIAILKSSPVLKEMIVKGFSCDSGFMRELLFTPRASQGLLFKYFCNECGEKLRRRY